MALRLYDTYSRQVREFEPLQPPRVGLYACGLTVYDYAHIGNLRTYIFEDILRRTLEAHSYDVLHVQNITDVGHLVSDADTGEDKMEKGSRRTGKSAWEIAKFFTEAFRRDLAALNVLEPHIWPKATDHIAEQIALIQCIEEQGYTYLTSDGVYFDTSRLADYGALARLDVEGLQAGARVDLGEKRNPTDFALWKFSPPGEQRQMEWDSPWGVGFPGWHIECSAMAAKYLGPYFDIHCGGEDHIPVHHTNEIAQSEACYKTRLANFWMHGYFLVTSGEKMAKSKDHFVTLEELFADYDPLVVRFHLLRSHYRSVSDFSEEGLQASAAGLKRLREAYRNARHGLPEGVEADAQPFAAFRERFAAALDDDLNTPQAIAVLFDAARDVNRAVEEGASPAYRAGAIALLDELLGEVLGVPPAEDAVHDALATVDGLRRRG